MSQTLVREDLLKSGLTKASMDVQELTASHLSMCGLPEYVEGYVMPYTDISGVDHGFYRLKLFNSSIKYMQPKDTPTAVYFPKDLNLTKRTDLDYIIITEGEKKAAKAASMGFPAVALGGVNCWRNRTIVLPKDVEFTAQGNGNLVGKLPKGITEVPQENVSTLAMGLQSIIDLIVNTDTKLIILFDTDAANHKDATLGKWSAPVQAAAANMAFELQYRGLAYDQIKQLTLPTQLDDAGLLQKVGLDDFLCATKDHRQQLTDMLEDTKHASSGFPIHPNIRRFINIRLGGSGSRKLTTTLAMAMLANLDGTGTRMFSTGEQQAYYFDRITGKLLRVGMNSRSSIQESAFGKLVYKRFGVSPDADNKIMQWLGAMFIGEGNIHEVVPSRVLRSEPSQQLGSSLRKELEEPDKLKSYVRNRFNVTPQKVKGAEYIPNSLEYSTKQISEGGYLDMVQIQLGDGCYAEVTGDATRPIEIFDNGQKNVMFEGGYVKEIKPEELIREFNKQLATANSIGHVPMLWDTVLQDVRLKNRGTPTINEQFRKVLGLLFYASPFLYKWRKTQLPVEVVIGEAGSGKSSLYELRQAIITGIPELKNAPSDMKDWHSSVVNSGGMHVIDNVQLLDSGMQHSLSDELCRLVTSPNPKIDMRQYYTNVGQLTIDVGCTFCFTSVSQPFKNIDILQRSLIIDLEKQVQDNLTYQGEWVEGMLHMGGGRVGWLAHQLLVLHKFFERVNTSWSENFRSRHRLINLEQTLIILADVVGTKAPQNHSNISWVTECLTGAVEDSVGSSDWILEGLIAYGRELFAHQLKASTLEEVHKGTGSWNRIHCSDIVRWASDHEDFMDSVVLTNARKLGRYITRNQSTVGLVACLRAAPKYANKTTYTLDTVRLHSKINK